YDLGRTTPMCQTLCCPVPSGAFVLPRTDLTVPNVECLHHGVRRQRGGSRHRVDQVVVPVTAELLDHLLTLLWSEIQSSALNGWARVEIALVVCHGVDLGCEHVVQHLHDRGQLVRRLTLRDYRVVSVRHPGEIIESGSFDTSGLPVGGARFDVPARGDRCHRPGSVSHIADDLTGTCGVGVNVLIQLSEIVPGFVPAVLWITGVFVAQNVWKAHEPGSPRAGISRPGVPEVTGVCLGPVQDLLRCSRNV